jgi:pyruvate,orthophosphate dikinase
MTRAGLPVPPGLIVTTQACNAFFDNDKAFLEGMWEQVKEGLQKIEEKVGKSLAIPRTRCWSRSDPAPPFRCPE